MNSKQQSELAWKHAVIAGNEFRDYCQHHVLSIPSDDVVRGVEWVASRAALGALGDALEPIETISSERQSE